MNNQGPEITGDTIKIGFIGPLTGDAASLGENALKAVQLAAEEINNEGGINGVPMEVVFEDGHCAGKEATNAANKLINNDGVSVIVGGLCSAETSAFAPVAETAEVPTVSYCSSAAAISQAGDYIFRVYPSDSYQGVFAANYIKNELNKNKVAVIYTQDDWGVGLQETFIKEFEKLGGEVTVVESFKKTDRDLRTQMAKIKASNPEAVYFLGFNEASIPGIQQMAELGIKVPVMGGDTWTDQTIWEAVGEAGEGFMYSEVRSLDDKEFEQKMQARGAEVALCAPQAYDAVNVIAEAMAKVGNDGTLLKDELYKTEYEGGVSSELIKFDENGDPVGASYKVSKIESGVPVEIK